MARKNKIIPVPMSEDLVAELDAISQKQDRSRASVIREAAAEYITRANEAEKVRRYVEGYEQFPKGEEERAWAEAGEP